jgi:flagellar secretion chaperone FliS
MTGGRVDPNATYARQAASTASPAQLVLMLYDGAIVRLEIATDAIAGSRPEAAHTALVRAQAIVDELDVTLDVERGGQLATNLRELYRYCSTRLVAANLAKDATIVAEVQTTLQGLRDAWHEACVLGPVAVAG